MRHRLLALALLLASLPAAAAIRRDPVGVNVNSQGATTVFITFGGLQNQVPVEAFWCHVLVPASPDLGQKCDPSSIIGRLPLRYDQSRLNGGAFTDIMTIPPSVSRRAFQRAETGETGTFFYVRRFQSTTGGPDEFVPVTCRLVGQASRVPLALMDVRFTFGNDQNVGTVEVGGELPRPKVVVTFNGSGQLRGRWEIVNPGEELPSTRDLLTEATLPVTERGLQRRYTLVDRFSVFLSPGSSPHTIEGPDPRKLPTAAAGLYLLLFRVEVTSDRETDSNLGDAGAGQGIVYSGGVAGFPMPVLRYVVGSAPAIGASDGLSLLLPAANATVAHDETLVLSWTGARGTVLYRVEVLDAAGNEVLAATIPPGSEVYRAPSWLKDKATEGLLKWRVRALGPDGETSGVTEARNVRFASAEAK